MGTRGIFGFYYKGKYYVVYNHWDSYPSGLGVKLLSEIITAIKAGLVGEESNKIRMQNRYNTRYFRLIFDKLVCDKIAYYYDQQEKHWIDKVMALKIIHLRPTKEDQEIIVRRGIIPDLKVGEQSMDDWYCLLRNCQGSFDRTLQSGYIDNHVDVDGKPYWQQYGYIVNLDDNTLDFHGNYGLTKFPLIFEEMLKLNKPNKWEPDSDDSDC